MSETTLYKLVLVLAIMCMTASFASLFTRNLWEAGLGGFGGLICMFTALHFMRKHSKWKP